MFTLLPDWQYAVRTLQKKPGFALIAIVILAVGIVANTAVISIVNAILFRPRPVAQPERLVELYVGDASDLISSLSDYEKPIRITGVKSARSRTKSGKSLSRYSLKAKPGSIHRLIPMSTRQSL